MTGIASLVLALVGMVLAGAALAGTKAGSNSWWLFIVALLLVGAAYVLLKA